MSKRYAPSDRADVYARVTAEIIAAIEVGAGEWRMPWHHDGASTSQPTNVASGKRYRGINTVALWVAAVRAGYDQGLWGTYRQWLAAGAQVRKDEKATTVVLWKELALADDGNEESDNDSHGRRRMFARAFSVFNIAQVHGYEPEPAAILPETERFAHAETFIANLGIRGAANRRSTAMSNKSNPSVATMGIDIGKNSFHVVGLDQRGAIVLRQKWSRDQIEARLVAMPPCLIGMEACVGAHHLSSKLQAYGHDARLMPAKYVRAYSKGSS